MEIKRNIEEELVDFVIDGYVEDEGIRKAWLGLALSP